MAGVSSHRTAVFGGRYFSRVYDNVVSAVL
jgi:hypothetical protein